MLKSFYTALPLVLLFALAATLPAKGQGFYTDFGKNRVQYNDFVWNYYSSEHFTTYFYQGGKDLGIFALTTAEQSLAEIEQKLEFKSSTRIEIMMYHNLSDLKQTNIGMYVEQNNTGGITKIIDNKLFVYFDGNHQHLARDIREGIARILLQKMTFGGNLQEILQNAVLLHLPEWFTSGLVAYIGEEWSEELDNKLRQSIAAGQMTNFNRKIGAEATFAGHALWHYIARMHGESAIPNLLYMTRINRNLESGFWFVLGNSFETVLNEFNAYYTGLYAAETADSKQPADSSRLYQSRAIKTTKPITYEQLKISPNGKFIAYTTQELGLQKVHLLEIATGNKRTILRNGFKSYEFSFVDNYPLLAWDAQSQKLGVIYEKRDQVRLLVYDPEKLTREEGEIVKFQQIADFCFTDDPRKIIVSAANNGNIDLYSYYIPLAQVTQLTQDFYDDLNPRYVKLRDREGIVFASNRTDDTLRTEKIDSIMPLQNFDIYFYNLAPTGAPLVQLTNTPLVNESTPLPYDSTYVAYISPESGINNLYLAEFDSIFIRTEQKVFFNDSTVINPTYDLSTYYKQGIVDTVITRQLYKTIGKSFPISNYASSLLRADIAVAPHQAALLFKQNSKYNVYTAPLANNPKQNIPNLRTTSYRQRVNNQAANNATTPISMTNPLPETPVPATSPEPILPTPTPPPTNAPIDIDNYFFQSEFDYAPADTLPKNAANSGNTPETDPSMVAADMAGAVKNPYYRRTKTRVYAPQFNIDQIVSQIDNTIIFNQYQNFNLEGGGVFSPPDLNGLIKVGISDLLEDYRIIGGFRLPLDLSGSEYFLEYQANKKRLDKKLLLYRRANVNNYSVALPQIGDYPVEVRNITNYVQTSLSYPFDINTALRWHIGYRGDKAIFLSTDSLSMQFPTLQENWLYSKLEYVFDNTIETGLNLRNGLRYKVYLEAFKPFDAQISDRNLDFNIKNTGFLGTIGADVRYYQKVHKQIIWANRFAAAHSYGSRKVVYFLGGVENWLQYDVEKRFDTTTPIDPNGNYSFQALATNMRGFRQNVRNGNSYAVFNSELRIPVFSYMSNKILRSEFLRSFQLLAFVDMGTAWKGLSPFNDDNQYAIVTVGNPPVTATVRYFRSPMVIGYGLGARAKLLGYFFRCDTAWGWDSGATTPKPMWQLSLGTDF